MKPIYAYPNPGKVKSIPYPERYRSLVAGMTEERRL
jgi:hypothetical protein